jgi:LysW-gamma-L-lysine carboxypeptidase
MLLGHIDTVTGDIGVRIDGDVLYGRGAVDAKGPLAAFASAAAQSLIPDGWRVVVIGAVEEEIASSTGAHHARECFAPDLCI